MKSKYEFSIKDYRRSENLKSHLIQLQGNQDFGTDDLPVIGDGGSREEKHNDASPFALGGGDMAMLDT